MTQKSLEEKRAYHNEYMKRWREKNPKRAFGSPEWRKLNPEKAKLEDKKKRERYHTKRLEYAKKYNPTYYGKNKEKHNAYSKQQYQLNHEERIEKAREYYEFNKKEINQRKRISRVELNEFIRAYKMQRGCRECGESHPACLEFHHLDRKLKEGAIAGMVSGSSSKEKILKEIEKCIILCSNCHKKEHYRNGLLGQ